MVVHRRLCSHVHASFFLCVCGLPLHPIGRHALSGQSVVLLLVCHTPSLVVAIRIFIAPLRQLGHPGRRHSARVFSTDAVALPAAEHKNNRQRLHLQDSNLLIVEKTLVAHARAKSVQTHTTASTKSV